MSLPGVEAIVRERLGLEPQALGDAALTRAIETRMRARGAATMPEYLALVAVESGERDSLAAELVVPETWFFRGGRALFDMLADDIRSRAIHRPSDAPVRVLSIPCSTGEEPVSLAIALLEHRVSPAAYQIVGIDLSESHVERAKAGRYSAFAFRDNKPDQLSAYFQPIADRWQIRASVCETIRYQTGNAADLGFLAIEPPFDLILCRNLFIYLTAPAQLQVMTNFERLLSTDGRLVLSPSEADRLPRQRFVAIGPPEFGIYRRSNAGDAASRTVSMRRPPTRQSSAPAAATVPAIPVKAAKPSAITRAEPIPEPLTLSTARKLADAGQLPAARAVCEQLLAKSAGSADAYSLLGVILLAERRPVEAAAAFRKALYLNPTHREALEHSIVLCESNGDAKQAAVLRKRLARVSEEDAT